MLAGDAWVRHDIAIEAVYSVGGTDPQSRRLGLKNKFLKDKEAAWGITAKIGNYRFGAVINRKLWCLIVVRLDV